MKTSRRRRFVTLAILLTLVCNVASLESEDISKVPDSRLPESAERAISRQFKFLAEANNDVFLHSALRGLITVLRTNILDPGSRRAAEEEDLRTGNSPPLNKRSPLAVGFVSGLGEDHHGQHAVFLNPETSHHHDISAVAKSGGGASSVVVAAHHAEGAGSAHGPNHLGLDGATTVLVHQPVVIHEVAAPSAVHLSLHEVAKAVVHQQQVDAATKVTITHHSAPPQAVIVNTEPAATIVVVPHSTVDLTHTVTHVGPTATESESSSDNYREHVGGYGVGVDFGGAGAGHGYYAG